MQVIQGYCSGDCNVFFLSPTRFRMSYLISLTVQCSKCNNTFQKPFLSLSFSGKLGPMWWQLQSVVSPDLRGIVCWSGRGGGLYLHKLYTARLRQGRVKTKNLILKDQQFCCKPQLSSAYLNFAPCGSHFYLPACPWWLWCYFHFPQDCFIFSHLQHTSVTLLFLWLVSQPIN